MQGRLFLHIGPPKSGTTSLQVAMENLDNATFLYGGVLQPRERPEITLANRLHVATVSDHPVDHKKPELLLTELKHLIDAGKIVFLSEEMFMVTSGTVTWEMKLAHLAKLLDGLPFTILVTLRDPLEGLPSLYQEIFKSLPIHEQFSFKAFCRGDAAKCYDFCHVENILRNAGVKNIQFIDFDLIRNGGLATNDLFGDQDPFDGRPIAIGEHNSSEKKRSHESVRRVEAITVRSLANLPKARGLLKAFGLFDTRAMRWIGRLAERVVLRNAGYRQLQVPKSEAVAFSNGFHEVLAKCKSWL